MDSRGTDRTDEPAVAETPEDVAVLYSWANLHGAKYRDFSASRREYRAQLRHRAAEQVREQALLAQAEAEAAAAAADSAARHAADAARTHQADDADSSMRRALREAEEAARTAAAERVEAARRAEAAAVAEAAARREEREIAEAHASAQRQAARYADSEIRRKAAAGLQQEAAELPGRFLFLPSLCCVPRRDRQCRTRPLRKINRARTAIAIAAHHLPCHCRATVQGASRARAVLRAITPTMPLELDRYIVAPATIQHKLSTLQLARQGIPFRRKAARCLNLRRPGKQSRQPVL